MLGEAGAQPQAPLPGAMASRPGHIRTWKGFWTSRFPSPEWGPSPTLPPCGGPPEQQDLHPPDEETGTAKPSARLSRAPLRPARQPAGADPQSRAVFPSPRDLSWPSLPGGVWFPLTVQPIDPGVPHTPPRSCPLSCTPRAYSPVHHPPPSPRLPWCRTGQAGHWALKVSPHLSTLPSSTLPLLALLQPPQLTLQLPSHALVAGSLHSLFHPLKMPFSQRATDGHRERRYWNRTARV